MKLTLHLSSSLANLTESWASKCVYADSGTYGGFSHGSNAAAFAGYTPSGAQCRWPSMGQSMKDQTISGDQLHQMEAIAQETTQMHVDTILRFVVPVACNLKYNYFSMSLEL